MKEIKVEGFTLDTHPDDKPSLCVFGEENVGKTRLACTIPHDDGYIGYLALDKNAKRTVNKMKEELGLPVIVNAKPFLSDSEANKLAIMDGGKDKEKVKEIYVGVVQRVLEFGTRLSAHKDVESIVLDTGSQFFDYILFSHFGRRNQIDSFLRGAPNQDMIDFVNAVRTKNFCVLNRSSEIWKDTGETDRSGKKVQAPTGKYKPDGFGKIGYLMTGVIELTSKRTKVEEYSQKYRAKVVTCKGNTLMEGQDLHEYGVSGEEITWDNIMMAIGVSE